MRSIKAPSVGAFSTLRWCPFWASLLLFALLVPTDLSFSMGSLRLTVYRVVLIVAFIPSLLKLLSGKAGRINIVDILMFIHIVWAYMVIAYHHGGDVAIESGGIRMLELGGGYLIARTTIVNQKAFIGVTSTLFMIMSVLAPITLIESVTGIHVIRQITSIAAGHSFSGIGSRMGLYRAYGPFDHPILYGVLAASVLGLVMLRAVPQLGRPTLPKYPRIAVIVSALTSMSSGALASLSTQFLLLFWNKKSASMKSRWKKLTMLILVVYFIVDMISNRSAMKVFLSYLTFSPGTAYNRIIIFEWGIQDVWRNPVWGLGFNVWTRPDWMHSTSMDNFWLVQAVTFGLPGFLTLSMAVIIALSRNWANMPQRIGRLRTGWTISFIGMILSACTVHFWNALFVYFAFFLGMGAWFLQLKRIPTEK